jgi:diguanylate cyclase (GGDEF)-like protein
VVILVLLSAVLAAAVVWLLSWIGVARHRLEAERERNAALEIEVAALQRQEAQLQTQQQFLVRFLRELPHFAHELHDGNVGRKIPKLVLSLIVRILEPAQAMVAVRRRPAEGEPERGRQLVVAAVFPERSAVTLGTEVVLGEGAIGFAAEVQRVMDRRDLDGQPPDVRVALRRGGLPGFEPDLVAPLVAEGVTVGAIAVQGLKRYTVDLRDILRVVAQTGAMAVRGLERLTAVKTTANVDSLTGIFNKGFLTHQLSEELKRARDSNRSLSVFMFDIDNFKHYNDHNGHVAGDQLLRTLARLVQDNVRRDSLFGRFGGEEFLLIMPGTGREKALAAAENIRGLLARHPFAHAAGQPLGCLSISGGVSTFPEDGTESSALVRSADEALYSAKHAGRNRVEGHVRHYLGEEAQEPVEPPEIPTHDEEDEAEATGPLDLRLIPDSPRPGELDDPDTASLDLTPTENE